MKKEASGKKAKWLWLVLGIVALLAVVGVVLALILGGGNGKTAGGRPDLYWNVDKAENVDRDTGLSIRKPAEDGNYYVRFAHDGEQVEIPVADKKLVNYIDSLDLMSLTLDDNGFVVDILPVKDVANIIGESLYVQNVSGDTLIANSSIMMNGRKITIKINEQTGVYNVSGKGEFVGESLDVSTLNPMDTISAYGTLVAEDSEEESEVTHVFVLKKPAESKIYFRADQFYDSTNKVTTREPDENGAYTIKWYCEGETVELKCKNKELVNTIDAANYHWSHWGLEFDEEGYIIDILDSFLASRTLMQCERYDITEIDDDGNYTATSLMTNNGAFVQGTVGADCAIYDISSAAKSEGQVNRKVDKLQLGDRVCIWTDTMGNPVQIYVTARRVDSPAYWVVTRSYNSTTMQTTRTPNDKGLYEIELLKAGDTKNTIYYTDDIEIATAVDYPSDRVVGLKLDGNKIEYVYDIEALFGNTYFVRGYYILDATASVCTYLSPSGSGYSKNGVLAADAKVYNVSTVGKYGAETTLQPGDYVYAGKTPTGEVSYAYVVRRALKNGENMFYWRIDDRQYDSVNKVTTRETDAEGYYVYLFAHNGKQVTLKTKNKDFATALDYQSSAPGFALEVKGDIITAVHEGTYAYGGVRINSWTIKSIDRNEFTAVSSAGVETTYTLANGFKCWNVSNSYIELKGEKTTMKVGDVIAGYRNMYGEIQCVVVKTRRTNKMAWPVAPETDRQPAKDGWYYIKLAVDGKIQEYKCKSKVVVDKIDEYQTPFGIQVSGNEILYMSTVTYVEGVKGAGVTNATVESASRNSAKVLHTVGAADKVGTKETVTFASGVKIYDVTEEARLSGKLGTATTLKKGDVIRTYRDEDGNQLYIYVISRHTKDTYAYCAHCDKPVYWTPYIPSSNAGSDDAHYYLATDLKNICAQIRVYSTTSDFEIVLDLNGKTISREGGRLALVRYNDTLTIIDSSKDQSGKMITKNVSSNGALMMVSQDTKTYGEAGGPGIVNVGTANVWGGTLTVEADATFTTRAQKGGVIYNTGILNVYNGKIENGVAARGGNIYSDIGTVTIYGGTITGGIADTTYGVSSDGRGGNICSTGDLYIKGGTITNGQTLGNTFGGNIMSTGMEQTVYISGGKVSGGTSTKSDKTSLNNIYLMYSNLEVSGGTIDAGKLSGTVISCTGTSTGGYSTITISGGTIKGDVVPNGSAVKLEKDASGQAYYMDGDKQINVYYNKDGSAYTLTSSNEQKKLYVDYKAVLNLKGGKVEGTVNAVTTQEINVSGNPVIKMLKLGGNKVNVTTMSAGASITTDSVGIISNAMASKAAADAVVAGQYFKSTNTELILGANEKNELKIYHPHAIVAYCEHCKENVDFIPTDKLPTGAGHYTLTDDVTVTESATDTTGASIAKGVATVLDLAGHTVTGGENIRPFYVSGTLAIMDSSEGETGVITGGSAIRGGNIYVNAGTFELYSGTIAGGVADNELGTSTTNGRGGNIFSTGNVFLYGGKVIDGVAKTGSGFGGNICIAAASASYSLYIGEGAVVSGGDAKTGGNIYVLYSKATLKGGVIADGTATTGGNLYTSGSNTGGISTVTIESGEIRNGDVYFTGGVTKTTKDGQGVEWVKISGVDYKVKRTADKGNFYVKVEEKNGQTVETDVKLYLDYRTNVEIVGGNLDCAVTANTSSMKLSGNPVIKNLSLSTNVLTEVGTLTEGASVAVNAAHGVISKPVANKAAAEKAIANGYIAAFNSSADKIALNDKKELIITNKYETEHETFYCEECDQNVIFDSWHGSSIAENGHYYLTDQVDLTSAISISSAKNVVVELNGQKIVADGCRAFSISGGAILSIQDSVGGGEITGGNAGTGRGGNIYASGESTLNLYGGKIYGGTANADWNMEGHDVAVFNSTLTINGNVQIGQAYETGHAVLVFQNGDIKRDINLTKGSVNGGVHLRGMIDGRVVNLGGDMNIDVIDLRDSSVLTAVEDRNSSDKIAVRTVKGAGIVEANVFTAALSNAATAATYFESAESGYEIVVNSDNTLSIAASGSTNPEPDTEAFCEHCQQDVLFTSWNGAAISESGHYFVADTVNLTSMINLSSEWDVVIDLKGQRIVADGCRAFYVYGNATLSIQDSVGGGEITGGTSGTGRGGNIYASGANVKLYGGKIYGGTANADWNNEGHDVAVNNGTLLIDGNVEIGQAYSEGHAVYAMNCTSVNLIEGTITGGLHARSNVTLGDGIVIDKISIRTDKKLLAVGNLTLAAPIKVMYKDFAEGIFTDALDNAATVATYFETASVDQEIVVNSDNTLEIKNKSTEPDPGPGTEPDPVVPAAPTNCEHCDEQVTWTAWDANTLSAENILAGGHYYLTGAVTVTGSNIAVEADNDVVIDLMGYSITAPADSRAFYVYGTLSIQDSSAEKTGAIIGGTVNESNGGNIYVNGGTLNLYSGTISGGTAKGKTNPTDSTKSQYGFGGAIYATSNGTVNLEGGTVTGGKALRGGNIYLNGGTLNIVNATVTAGVADNNLKPSGCTAATNGRGGNIFLTNTTTTISGGTISDGQCINATNTFGGNLMIYGDTNIDNSKQVTITGDVVISGGEAKKGSSVALCYTTVTMNGGTITDGIVYMFGSSNVGSKLSMSAGTIENLTTDDAAPAIINTVEVSSTAKINAFKLGEGDVVTVGSMADGAKIMIDAESGAFTAAFTDKNAAEAVLPYFDAVAHNKIVAVADDNALEIVAGCECGCKTLADQVVWEDANAFIAAMAEAGNYRINDGAAHHLKLSADLNVVELYGTGKQINVINGSKVTIDLNGFTWSTEGTRALYIGSGSELTIMNGVETEGYVTSTGSTLGGGVINNENGTLNLRSGTIKLVPGANNPVVNAGVIYQNGSAGTAVFNMYGGTISGGVINKTASANGYGGNVHLLYGIFNMYGGTISGGIANGATNLLSCGGNLAVRSDATANLYGGTISGGTADIADSIYAEGAVNIAPEMIIDGEIILQGANVTSYLANSLVSNAYIMHNVTFVLGADVTIADIMDPTQIYIGKKNEANVNVTIDLNGYTWTGNHRLRVEAGSTLNFKDSSENKTGVMQSTGNATNAGRIVTNYGTLNIYGGTFKMVEDETVHVKGGGLIYISSGEFNLYGGTITGGKTLANENTSSDKEARGGNVYIYNATFNMYGGTIENGTATGAGELPGWGGNVCIREGAINLNGGTITGGTATLGGNIYVMADATLNNTGNIAVSDVYEVSAS